VRGLLVAIACNAKTCDFAAAALLANLSVGVRGLASKRNCRAACITNFPPSSPTTDQRPACKWNFDTDN